MGQFFSSTVSKSSGIHCLQEEKKVGPDEFKLTLDASAFEFHLLSNIPKVRITLLGLNGAWGTPKEYSKSDPYSDANLDIWPETRYEDETVESKASKSVSKTALIKKSKKDGAFVVIKKPISVLIKPFQNRITTLLCRNKNYEPVVFASVVLKRRDIQPGTYFLRQDTIFMSGTNLVIVGLPDTARVGNLASLSDKNFDPNLTLFMASSLPSTA